MYSSQLDGYCNGRHPGDNKAMLCLKPIEVQTKYLPCGQCMNCRINKQRIWSSRIQLEAMFHAESIFVTLTYNDETVPIVDGVPVLYKRDLTLFIKRLRKRYSNINKTFRFFACGEYGSETQRPHYHAIFFGLSVDAESAIEKSWGNGFHLVAPLSAERASYVAQYTLKKMTQEDSRGLNGRPPEFASMSTRPGIGFPAIAWLKHHAGSRKMQEAIIKNGDVFNSIRIDGRIWPVGNYIKRKLRDELGLSQDAQERQIQLENFDPDTGETFEPPTYESFCPLYDIADANTPRRITNEKKETQKNLPDLKKQADHKARKTHRRAVGTVTI